MEAEGGFGENAAGGKSDPFQVGGDPGHHGRGKEEEYGRAAAERDQRGEALFQVFPLVGSGAACHSFKNRNAAQICQLTGQCNDLCEQNHVLWGVELRHTGVNSAAIDRRQRSGG